MLRRKTTALTMQQIRTPEAQRLFDDMIHIMRTERVGPHHTYIVLPCAGFAQRIVFYCAQQEIFVGYKLCSARWATCEPTVQLSNSAHACVFVPHV